MARWKKGQSGNPAGRPKGAGEVMQLRAKLKPHLDDVLAALASAQQRVLRNQARRQTEQICATNRDKSESVLSPQTTLTARG